MKINLSNLAEASRQQVFDQVMKHLLTQKERSKHENGPCAYRGEQGRMCAAGCLIADEEYFPAMDDHGSGLDWSSVVLKGYAVGTHMDLIEALQMIHDNSHPQLWEAQLKALASQEGLIFKGVPIDITV